MNSRGEESWQRRIGNETELWDYLAQQRLWVTIKNGTTVSENNHIFESLTPLQKYKLISPLVKKIQQAQYNKDNTMSIQVLREEANKLLTVTNIENFPVSIEKHKFFNRIRGIIESPALCLMPENEIIEDSNNLYYRLCGYNIHCLATSLIVTIILIIIVFIIFGLLFYYRKRIFPCLKEDQGSTHDLNDISNYLLAQNNARISAKFVGKNSEVHITSTQSEETA